MSVPSGENEGFPTDALVTVPVRSVVAPPAALITRMFGSDGGVRWLPKAIRAPSGDQLGSLLEARTPEVRLASPWPLALIVKTSTLGPTVASKAILDPSGENSGASGVSSPTVPVSTAAPL